MTFRQITTHQLAADGTSPEVLAADERGPDGSHHVYYIAGLDGSRRPHLEAEYAFASDAAFARSMANPAERFRFITIPFQSGSPAEHGVNGVTIESLLAVAVDRLQGLQSGPFACAENATVLTNLRASIATLHGRTRRREVEGTAGTAAP